MDKKQWSRKVLRALQLGSSLETSFPCDDQKQLRGVRLADSFEVLQYRKHSLHVIAQNSTVVVT